MPPVIIITYIILILLWSWDDETSRMTEERGRAGALALSLSRVDMPKSVYWKFIVLGLDK